jgi:hypothetical protein
MKRPRHLSAKRQFVPVPEGEIIANLRRSPRIQTFLVIRQCIKQAGSPHTRSLVRILSACFTFCSAFGRHNLCGQSVPSLQDEQYMTMLKASATGSDLASLVRRYSNNLDSGLRIIEIYEHIKIFSDALTVQELPLDLFSPDVNREIGQSADLQRGLNIKKFIYGGLRARFSMGNGWGL